MLLALHDVPVERTIIEKLTPLHRKGVSLAELKEASNALGLKTEVRRCSIDQLRRSFQSPVITCLVSGSDYHYVVVIELTDDSVTVLDGTTGERNTFPCQWLNQFWSGYVLIADSGPSVPLLLLAVSLFGWLLLGFLVLKKNRYSIPIMMVFALGILPDRPSVMAAQSLDGPQVKSLDWAAHYRTPENDAVNCLYLQLRLLGYTGSYAAFREQLPDEPRSLSLVSLANLSRELGFRLMPVKMTVSELAQARTPVIVHFEESEIGSGRFLLFLGMGKSETTVVLIDGAYLTFAEMPRDQFRRKWTGYALIARPFLAWKLWMRRSVTVLLVGGVGIWLARRPRNLAQWLVLFGRRERLCRRG